MDSNDGSNDDNVNGDFKNVVCCVHVIKVLIGGNIDDYGDYDENFDIDDDNNDDNDENDCDNDGDYDDKGIVIEMMMELMMITLTILCFALILLRFYCLIRYCNENDIFFNY